jgi:hypothetical protein
MQKAASGEHSNEMVNWDHANRTLSPIRANRQNHLPLRPISISKRSNFENRTELIRSGGSEKNSRSGRFLPFRGPAFNLEIATDVGLNCHKHSLENMLPRGWIGGSSEIRTHGTVGQQQTTNGTQYGSPWT